MADAVHRLFIIAIISVVTIGSQNYFFAASAASLTKKLRSLSFRAVLRQDSELFLCTVPLVSVLSRVLFASVEYFDRDENSVRLTILS